MGLVFLIFFYIKRVLKSSRKKARKQMRKNLKQLFFWDCPAECAVAGERLERGPERQKCRILGKRFWKGFWKVRFYQLSGCDLARSSLPYGQGGGLSAARDPPGQSCMASGLPKSSLGTFV